MGTVNPTIYYTTDQAQDTEATSFYHFPITVYFFIFQFPAESLKEDSAYWNWEPGIKEILTL